MPFTRSALVTSALLTFLSCCAPASTPQTSIPHVPLDPNIPMTLSSPCDVTKGTNYCTPVGGCFLGTNLRFKGRSFGRTRGPIIGQLTNGARCTGNWALLSDGKSGQGTLQCSNDLGASLNYGRLDRATGSIFGFGESTQGGRVVAWSGVFARGALEEGPYFEKMSRACETL